jgi:hypothetical protein
MNFFYGSIMQMPKACLGIHLSLIAWFLIIALLGIGALICPMTNLIAVEAWLVVPWPSWASLTCAALR